MYDLDSLSRRRVAFDGTVESVHGDSVSFTVHEWFRGGSGAEAELAGATSFGGITVGNTIDLTRGLRLLVAGDGGFAWACGFTQPHGPELAGQWRATLTR